ncbi:MAG TPA: class I SAM-dependent methyltransferase [Jatrophihabitans sp.]|nr:class I SAM-dependent methyltransferase [Jatrophihabitans sp.]
MTGTVIDVRAVRDQQRAVWDHVSQGWRRWQPDFERGAASVTARLLALAGIGPGLSVLDIGSGIGEPALSAARAVGPTGKVTGIDLSAGMIAAARDAAAELANVEFLVGDLETAQLAAGSFDAALSRWALMFAADRSELLRAAAAVLKPGGVLAAAVWGQPQDVPIISLGFRVISEQLGLPAPPPGPGPFSMSDPQALRADFEQAGFAEVEVSDVVAGFRFDSVEDFARFSRDVLPPGMKQRILEQRGSIEDAGVWNAVAAAAREYQRADGTVSLPSLSRCVRAVAGGAA